MRACRKCGRENVGTAAGIPTCKDCQAENLRRHARINMRRYRAVDPERFRAAIRKSNERRLTRLGREVVAKEQWASHLRRSFGMTELEYNERLERQSGGCAICGGGRDQKYRLSVDHSHNTAKIRGLLCVSCNTKIMVLDTWPWKDRAMEYLRQV